MYEVCFGFEGVGRLLLVAVAEAFGVEVFDGVFVLLLGLLFGGDVVSRSIFLAFFGVMLDICSIEAFAWVKASDMNFSTGSSEVSFLSLNISTPSSRTTGEAFLSSSCFIGDAGVLSARGRRGLYVGMPADGGSRSGWVVRQ